MPYPVGPRGDSGLAPSLVLNPTQAAAPNLAEPETCGFAQGNVPAVDLWWLDLDQAPPLDRLKTVLSAAERERTDRFRTPQLQHRFAACRAQLRGILARYLDCSPSQLHFDYGPQGKPRLGGAYRDAALEFNVSHCQGAALYGVARCPLGVDLEQVRPIAQPLALARRFFHASEVTALEALPLAHQSRDFLRHWVGKEAVLKAWGTGIAQGLDRVILTLQPHLQLQALPPQAGPWTLQELLVPSPEPSTIDPPAPAPALAHLWVAALATADPQVEMRWRSPAWEFLAENQEPRYNS